MTATVDTITDLIVAGLQAKIPGDFEFTGDFDLCPLSVPRFDGIEATERLQIKVSGIERKPVDNEKNRTSVNQTHHVGVFLTKKLLMENDWPQEADFREMKSLSQSIEQWLWLGISGFPAIDVRGALFDLEKSKAGIFYTLYIAVFKYSFDK